ncbi:eukaryotic translation initiation factor 2C, 2 [Rhizophlyctis rosea]|nr:eukaryotic translation initiation factor 2C, 2 [Rhizophlyctis rosea]
MPTATGPQQVGTFPQRPDFGTKGRRISVISNFFPLVSHPDVVYQYDVEVQPAVPSRINQQVFQAATKQYVKLKDSAKYLAYDGKKIAYAPKRLPLPNDETAEVEIELPEESGGRARNGGRKFLLFIKFAAKVDMAKLDAFVNGRLRAGDVVPLEAVTAMEVILRQYPALIPGCVGVGQGFYLRSLFNPSDRDIAIRGAAEGWSGMKFSVRPGIRGIHLLADVGTTAFRKAGNLIDLTADFLNLPIKDAHRWPRFTDRQRIVLEKSFKSFRIVTNHNRDFRRKYRVSGIHNYSADETKFEIEEENGQKSRMSVAEYFHKKYKKPLALPHLPCVVVNDKKTFLPMEVCEMLPGQRIVRKLDEVQTADMIRIAQKKPAERLNRIMQGVTAMVGQAKIDPRTQRATRTNETLQEFSLRVSENPAHVDARILEAPTIMYSPDSRQNAFKPSDGVWNLKDKKVHTPPQHSLRYWSVLVINARGDPMSRKVENFILTLVDVCKKTGLPISNGEPTIRGSTGKNVEDDLNRAVRDAAGSEGKEDYVQLVVVVLPDRGAGLYSEIKRVSDTILGIPTQCVQETHVGKPAGKLVQYCANVCLKINVKLGGYNACLEKVCDVSQLPYITEQPTMVIGADVCQPGPMDQAKPTITAMVGSMNIQCTEYKTTTSLQHPPPGKKHDDVIQKITEMTAELLREFYRQNKVLPSRILIYRNGLSDGQFAPVRDFEVAGILLACRQMKFEPKLTYVVAQRRHSARFFPLMGQGDRSGNVQAGTVVDTGVVHPTQFDFYLNAHAGLQGTSRPTHYRVLYDDFHFTADDLQDLTYKLSYLFPRCTRSVSLCAPVYQASLAAQRERTHFKDTDWSESGSSSSSAVNAEQQAAVMEAHARVRTALKTRMYYM